MKKIILYTFSIFIIISCDNHKFDTKNKIKINIDNKKEVSIYDFFKVIELIPLESKEEALINNIKSLLQKDSIIYILDDKQGIIFLFNNNGKYISKINRKGRGPGEYSLIYDMKINPYNHTLEVLNPMGELLVFSLNGNYLKSIRLPNPPTAYKEFSIINNDTILFYTLQEINSLHLYSRKQNKIFDSFYKEKKEYSTYSPIKSLFQYNDTSYFCRGLSDIIYKISNGKIKPAYEWDFGKYKFKPQEYISSDRLKNIDLIMKESKSLPYVYGYNLQNNKYLFTSIQKNEKILSIFYNKLNHQSTVFHKTSEGLLFIPHIFTDSIVLAKIDPGFTLQDFVRKEMLGSKDTDILNNLSDDSNPVLLKYIFK